MEAHKEKVTDLRYLVGLSNGNMEFVKEMVENFIRENPRELDIVERGISEQDFDLIRHGAHQMKSTIPFVGIDPLIGRPIAEIEQLAKDHRELKKIGETFERVKDICRRAVSELKGDPLAQSF